MSERKSYLGYVPKKANIQKLKQYISSGSPVKQKLPDPKPMKLNKRHGK